MGEVIQSLWGKMWGMHHKAKKTLMMTGDAPTPTAGTGTTKGKLKNVNPEKKPNYTKRQKAGLFLGPALFLFILLFLSPDGMSKEALAVLAGTAWIATWWITEAVPIPVASLLPIVLFPLTGAVDSAGAITSAYADPNIFLFMGGFMIALAMEKWNLHKRIAMNIILVMGTSTERLILGFMVSTGFLSMWISNTATAMMMMPIALAVIYQVQDSMKDAKEKTVNFSKAIMLGIAYGASIGGLGTLIGTPPNTIFASVVKQLYGIEISFAKWMMFGVPLAVILLGMTWIYLVKVAFPTKIKELPGGKQVIEKEKKALGVPGFEERLIFAVFVFTAFCWITRTFILTKFIPNLDDTIIAILAGIILFLLPAKSNGETRILAWADAKNLPWGILLLFGGGLAIAAGFKETGLATWIGEQLTVLQGVQFIIVVAMVTALVIFLTELTSNTATATMMFPIMASLALALNVHPYSLMIASGVAASCAFMMPVATPPNAIVFGSGMIKIGDMVKAGFWINIFCIVFITLMIYYALPAVWGIDLTTFPDGLEG
ncbi:anion transporter [[Bacillus] enclensis]|uniref:Sodium-dependent dicarboxylate transporter SdcS n=1 Tax=[Bacillus] enclensis TaxID=1402860 RepID=A0A0V8HDF9_9BACI|nr:DASS family sodium-coupled anion symporter [[Bacillus] enclensis]KSU60337.1 anion transporter [[Bacillus] enclensis]SCC23316.1 solute carrier family 13 (sodium-dependent dicarboxylate transporter), member 2/3/5 [[Bacillus] enclensis]